MTDIGNRGIVVPRDADDLVQVIKLLLWLRKREEPYFGKVTLSIEGGKVVHLKKEDSISIRRGDVNRMGLT